MVPCNGKGFLVLSHHQPKAGPKPMAASCLGRIRCWSANSRGPRRNPCHASGPDVSKNPPQQPVLCWLPPSHPPKGGSESHMENSMGINSSQGPCGRRHGGDSCQNVVFLWVSHQNAKPPHTQGPFGQEPTSQKSTLTPPTPRSNQKSDRPGSSAGFGILQSPRSLGLTLSIRPSDPSPTTSLV